MNFPEFHSPINRVKYSPQRTDISDWRHVVLILPIDDAQPGMKLAAPVLHPDQPGQQLLRCGYVLEAGVIRRMRDLHIEAVFVEYPGLEHLDKHLSVYLSPARQAVLSQIKKSITSVQQQTRPKISYADYTNVTRDLVTTLMEQGQNPIYLDQMSHQGTDSVGHGAAVAHLSLMLGLRLEQYLIDQRKRLAPAKAREVVNLGVAGMLHDVGMMKLPKELWTFTEVNPPQDAEMRKEWETHCRVGYDLVHDDLEPTAASAILHHHQHYDASGFPPCQKEDPEGGGMEGQRIHIYARIILCANLYDRLSAPIKGARPPNHQILQLMRTRFAGWIDPVVLKGLEAIVPAFPPGCRVKLTDESCAIIVDINPEDSLRPIVKRLAQDRWTAIEENIDLRKAGAPAVAGVM